MYRTVFAKLAEEEAEALANDRSEDSANVKLHFPSFGCSTTEYDDSSDSDVKQFYNAWLTFSSQKSFSWCDKYRLSEAPDRRIRRAMEKENKKFRDAARKEFNDTVLVICHRLLRNEWEDTRRCFERDSNTMYRLSYICLNIVVGIICSEA